MKPPQRADQVPVKTTTLVRERPVEIPAIQDSSIITALFACDSNNRVILKDYSELYSKYISVQMAVEPVGDDMQLQIGQRTTRPATTATVRDSIIEREVPVYLASEPYEVIKPLPWHKRALVTSGIVAWILLIVYCSIRIKRIFNP